MNNINKWSNYCK